MNRETLLDEAIAKAKEAEDWQLVEWLRMARGGESAAKWYTKKLRELEDENARLRSCLSDDAENARMIMAEKAKLLEMVWDMYCLAYPSAVGWEVSDEVYDKYSPCEKCHELHGGKSPCAGTSKDMAEECCKPIQAAVVADRMRELGIEVDA